MRLRDPQQQQEATNWTGSRTTQRDRQNAAGDTQMHCGGETGGETKIKERSGNKNVFDWIIVDREQE